MATSLYKQLNGGSSGGKNIFQQLADFKRNFSGNPQEIIQNMLNSGKLSQAQLNDYAKQADEIYKLFK